MSKRKYLLLILLVSGNAICAQDKADTVAMIKEFSKVMSFTAQPYVHYTTITKLNASPVLESTDTLSIAGEFFKSNTEIYSNNMKEELYLQDSFMININNDRKTIWISKVDMASKKNMDMLPANMKGMIESLQKNYTISRSKLGNDIVKMIFVQQNTVYSTSPANTTITVQYDEKTFLPKIIEIAISMKQPVDEAIEAAIKEEGADETKLIQTINAVKYLVRNQTMSISFTSVDNDGEKLLNIPSYKSILGFDEATLEFTGKGIYKDYEITKTF